MGKRNPDRMMEVMQLINEADHLEERKFFVAIANMVLQERQKEVIEKKLF